MISIPGWLVAKSQLARALVREGRFRLDPGAAQQWPQLTQDPAFGQGQHQGFIGAHVVVMLSGFRSGMTLASNGL